MSDALKMMSVADLEALQSGDLSKVSDKGLMLLQGTEASSKTDLFKSSMDKVNSYDPTDTLAGWARGAGSIGATLLAPKDALESWIAKRMGADMPAPNRRTEMDNALRTLGADPDSTQFKTNKLLAEVAGTSGVGGAVAKGVSMIPGATKALPTLIPAIQSGGMTANGAKGLYGMANRVAGGAVNGAFTAGLVNPDDASTGMVIGGATPPVIKAVGATGSVIGDALRSKPINPTLQQTAKESIEAGYVIPPNMVKPSFGNRVLESFSGKQATQQIASTKNTAVTEGLVRKALGIGPDVPLKQSTLESLRKTAGKAYADVSSLSPQAAADLEALMNAREEMKLAFNEYNKTGARQALKDGKQFKAVADSLETALETHAKAANQDGLVPALRQARKDIAKTYTVGRALNDAAGTVDAKTLARMYEKGLPLSDGLDVAGRFASAFPTVAKTPQHIGSPAAHNLTALLSTGLGGAGAAGGSLLGAGALATGGLGAVGAALPFVTPPIARSIMFSKPLQNSLGNVAGPSNGLLNLSLEEALPLIYRSNALLANGQ